MNRPRNKVGGLYEQFRLERLEDQKPLEETRGRPTVREENDFAKKDVRYW
jgi:hypothetical protein